MFALASHKYTGNKWLLNTVRYVSATIIVLNVAGIAGNIAAAFFLFKSASRGETVRKHTQPCPSLTRLYPSRIGPI